jgi:hypothetical protein
VQFKNFYCNWVAVGNVIVNADFSIDNINLKDRVFTGFYKVTFHGTGNAGGSGYYKAVITSSRVQARLESPEQFAAGSARMDMQ